MHKEAKIGVLTVSTVFGDVRLQCFKTSIFEEVVA